MTLLRAAPGKQQELLEEIESTIAGIVKARPDRRPLILRHAQGDHWDVMFLAPIGTYVEHFERRSAVNSAASPELVAWQEDEFVRGPDLSALPGFFDARVYHVEMFNALADKREELVRERIMENAFVTALGRPLNAIFVRELGASWDVFTIGAYRNWRHYAERDDTDPQKALAAARAAGFESDAAVATLPALSHQHPPRHVGDAGAIGRRGRCASG